MKKRFVVPTIMTKYMNVFITRNCKVLKKNVTRGIIVELDSGGTS